MNFHTWPCVHVCDGGWINTHIHTLIQKLQPEFQLNVFKILGQGFQHNELVHNPKHLFSVEMK